MPDVGDWQHIKQILETPWLGNLLTLGQILWMLGGVLLTGVAWFYKNFLKAMYARLALRVRGLPVKIYHWLGIVTQGERQQDSAQFQAELLTRDNRMALLEKQILELRKPARTHGHIRDGMTFKDSVYWLVTPDGKSQGPYCPRCFDTMEKAVPLGDRIDDLFWRCHVCLFTMQKPGAWRQIQVDTNYDPFSR